MSAKKILLALIILAIIGLVGFIWFQQDDQEADEDTQQAAETSEQVTENDEQAISDQSPEPTVIENDYFTLALPVGFSETDERIFTFTGAPQQHFSFINQSTGDYFEINRTPAQSGAASDFTWQYEYVDGEFIIQDTDVTLCDPAEDWCTTVGDARLDAALWPSGNIDINGDVYYFTFGNTQTESVDDLDFVDEFLAGLTF